MPLRVSVELLPAMVRLPMPVAACEMSPLKLLARCAADDKVGALRRGAQHDAAAAGERRDGRRSSGNSSAPPAPTLTAPLPRAALLAATSVPRANRRAAAVRCWNC